MTSSAPATPIQQSGPVTDRWSGQRTLVVLGAAVGYFVTARIGYAFTIRPAGISLWPASGFLLGLLLIVRRDHWPEVLLAAIGGNVVADLFHGLGPGLALGGGIANGIEAITGAWVVQRLVGHRVTMSNTREFGAVAIGAAVVSNAVTATLGAFIVARGIPSHFWAQWFTWWAGDGLGILVVAPVMLTWANRSELITLSVQRIAEFAVLCLVLAYLAWHALGPTVRFTDSLGVGRYLVFPLLFLVALRYGPWGASTAMLLVACIVGWKGAHADPAFIQRGMAPLDQLREVYAYVLVASCSAMIPAVELCSRRRAEQLLRQSEIRFRQMAEYIEDAFFVVDLSNDERLYVSPNWATLWARPLADAYSPEVWLDAVHPDDRDQIAALRTKVAAGKADSVRVRLLRPDGTLIWIRSRAFPVRNKDGVVYRMVGVATDITAIRNAEERVVQSQKMEALGRLAGGIAHDFNNMLTVILADTEMLAAVISGPAQEEALAEIRGAADRAAALTKQLLAFSRRQVVPTTVFDLNDVMIEMGQMLRRVIGEQIRLEVRPGAAACFVRGDRGRLEQVITNLALNARDAMPDGGRLIMETKLVVLDEAFVQTRGEVVKGEYVLLSVTDTGTGMSEAIRSRVFEPFFTTKPQGQGTGLGLATAFGIVQKSGGYLTAYSEPGTGSAFRMYLPLEQEGSVEGDAVPASSAPPEGTEWVLLVEDEEAVRRVTSRLLGALGYHVLEAETGKIALALLEDTAHPVTLLLTDVMLPGIGGSELAELVRATQPSMKVLFMSGYTEDEALNLKLLDQGARLLGKPFTRDELALTVREVLDS